MTNAFKSREVEKVLFAQKTIKCNNPQTRPQRNLMADRLLVQQVTEECWYHD